MLQSIDTLIAFVLIMTVSSLFVTVLVQMFSAWLSLRGKNLANALALTFQTIAPEIRGDAHRLAARILSQPLLSDSTMTEKDVHLAEAVEQRHTPWRFGDVRCAMQLASAIRPEEAYAALERLAAAARANAANNVGALRSPDERLTSAADKVLKALVVPEEEAAAIKSRLRTFLDVADQISDREVKERLLHLVEDTPAELMTKVDTARADFEKWFGSAQDRAQQWFRLHTRALTIGASALVALVLQLDAAEVYRHVSTNAAARAALLANVDQVVNQAESVLADKGGLIQRIAQAWARETGRLTVDVGGVTNVAELREHLMRGGQRFDEPAFDRVVRETTEAYYKEQRGKLTGLTSEVSGSGFDFIPVGYWRWPAASGWKGSLANILPHLPGIALFAALLTLGAPYWYNLLKNLASLRPAVAQLISKEEQPERGKNSAR